MAYLGWAILHEVTRFTAELALDIPTTTADGAWLLAVTNVVSFSVAVGTSDFRLLNHLLFLGAALHGVSNLLAVRAVRLEVIPWETSILKALEVLGGCLGPAFSQDGTARLRGLLERDLVLLIGVALQVDIGVNSRRNCLFLGNKVELEIGLAETLFKLNESKLRGKLTVHPEGLDEVIDIASSISSQEILPSLISVVGGRKALRIDIELLSASSGGVTSAGTLLAGGLSTFSGTMAFKAASAAGASEGTLDLGVRTVGLVVSDLAAVEAFTRHLAWLCAVTREVARLAAAAKSLLAETCEVSCANNLLAAGIVASVVLGN